MKDFVKAMLAVICGFIVLRLLGLLLMLFFMGSALIGGSSTSIPKDAVLDINMSEFIVSEQSQDTSMPDLSSLSSGAMTPQIGLRDAVQAIRRAASDASIRFIFLRPDGATAGTADLEELRIALSEFRTSGKPVLAYTENTGNGSYYLASVADQVLMGSQHGSTYQLIGLSGRMIFLKDVLEKLGVNYQLIRHGKYKSAGEMFIRNSASPENREQNARMISSIWDTFGAHMASSRDFTKDELDLWIDGLAFNMPEDFLEKGLVDSLVDHEALIQKLCTLAQVDDPDKLHLVSLADYISASVSAFPSRSNVAVIYADGEIIDGWDTKEISGDRFVSEIDKVRKDKSVKAVVLRVNSPGGSVSASVKIRRALDLLQQEKPLVASYGNYAASGGYWISNGCQKIYSDATCLTGSIGVFSMIPEFSEVTKKIGVNVETVGSHRHSDMYSLMRPFDSEELKYMQASVEDIYESFVNLVATSRDKDPEYIDSIAQGRVWTGADALEIGLVDEIGTLEDAISYAAALADMHSSDEYGVVAYPRPLTFMEQILESMGQSTTPSVLLEGTPFEAMGREMENVKAAENGTVFARLPYSIDIK